MEAKSKELLSVDIFLDGTVACFDEDGQGIPFFKGKWDEVKEDIIFADNGKVRYTIEGWGESIEIDRFVAQRLSIKAKE